MELKTLKKKLENFLENDEIFRYYGMLSEFGFLVFLRNLKKSGKLYMSYDSAIALNKFIDHKNCKCYFLGNSYELNLIEGDFQRIVATDISDEVIGVYVI